MAQELLITRQLKRHYKRGPHVVKALDGVDISVRKGELLALVGSSGSGKSTLLNLLAGLDTPSEGTISFEGRALSDMNRRELARYRAKNVGMVFQSFNLLPQYDALHNVAMALYFNDTPKKERLEKADEMLSKLGLAERLDHKPADLSGGEQQRVAIARALVKKPSILFADEPTGNLDQENTKQISSLLIDLHTQGLTVVMVTHDLELAKKIADRTIILDYGIIKSELNGGRREV